jgi:hypothetical protein
MRIANLQAGLSCITPVTLVETCHMAERRT